MGLLRQSGIITSSKDNPTMPIKYAKPSKLLNNLGQILHGGWDIGSENENAGVFTYAFLDDGGVFTDYTAAAKEATANDVNLLPAVEAVNDAFYIGSIDVGLTGTNLQFNAIHFNITTVGIGNTIVWEYYTGAAWAAVPGLTDGTSGFTASGWRDVTFTPPADWATTVVNGLTTYWIRARCTVAAFTQQPKAGQVIIFGDGDQFITYLIAEGNETGLYIGTRKGTAKAKRDVYINGVLDNSGYDDYAASAADNTQFIVVTQPIKRGKNEIKIVINGKNASATDYRLAIYGVAIS